MLVDRVGRVHVVAVLPVKDHIAAVKSSVWVVALTSLTRLDPPNGADAPVAIQVPPRSIRSSDIVHPAWMVKGVPRPARLIFPPVSRITGPPVARMWNTSPGACDEVMVFNDVAELTTLHVFVLPTTVMAFDPLMLMDGVMPVVTDGDAP